MALPPGRTPWPPPEQKRATDLYERWGAWYAGNPDKLAEVYRDAVSPGVGLDPQRAVRPGQYRGGMIGLAARAFWGTPPPGHTLTSARLHIPLASDIASASADMLFGEPPQASIPDAKRAQQRIEEYLADGGLAAVLLEAAEICAAYGGVYLRVSWDKAVAEMPLYDAIPPDSAVPEFRSGRLVAVTFWRVLPRNGDDRRWVHLERHEPGRVFHGLYAGWEKDKLGRQLPLAEHPETKPFAEQVDASGGMDTGADGLAADYVPNMRPNRDLRGSQLGRSDFAGVEPLMDSLDEAWTSWMRDLRLGKARLVVPRAYLTNLGKGKGAYFDAEQEIFETVEAMPSTEGLTLSQVQFNIRVPEHQQTCDALTAQAVRGAGYSMQTFGEAGDVAATATEVSARDRRTVVTRKRKIGYWSPSLSRILYAGLQIDAKQFGVDGLVPARPAMEWPDAAGQDPKDLAQTLQLLEAAKAVSTRTKVEILHPEWETEQVDKEVEAIDSAGMPPVPPPGAAGSDAVPDGQQPGQGGALQQPAEPRQIEQQPTPAPAAGRTRSRPPTRALAGRIGGRR